jgi:hypothetical protein
MRFTSLFASVVLLASSVSAQTSDGNDVDPNELLAELAELPECAVSELILLSLQFLQPAVEPAKLTSFDPDDLHSDSSPSFAMRSHKFRLPLHRRCIHLL